MSKRKYTKAEKRSYFNGFKAGYAKKEKEYQEEYADSLIETYGMKKEPFKYDPNSKFTYKQQQQVNDILDDITDIMNAMDRNRILRELKK